MAVDDEWRQWRADVETADTEIGPYSGISNAVAVRLPKGGPAFRPYTSRSRTFAVDQKTEINEIILPRTADIMALHDPQVARLDRSPLS